MKHLKFEALPDDTGQRDGEAGWRVIVDGKEIIPYINSDHDVSNRRLERVWEALEIKVEFDYE